MARPKGRPKKPHGVGAHVRIDPDLASKAKYLAAQGGVTQVEYLSAILRPILDREFHKAGRKLAGGDES